MRDGLGRGPVKLQVKVASGYSYGTVTVSNCIGEFMTMYFFDSDQEFRHQITSVFNRVCLTKLTVAMTMVSASVGHM